MSSRGNRVPYGILAWSMYGLGVVAVVAFWAYQEGFPDGRVPYAAIGLPALPFVALGKYLFHLERKGETRPT